MKTITTSEVSRGKHKLKFELEHSAVNKDTTNLSDALKHTAPAMLPMSTFNRVTGTMAAKESSGVILPKMEDNNRNIAERIRRWQSQQATSQDYKDTIPRLGAKNFFSKWKKDREQLVTDRNSDKSLYTLTRNSSIGQDPYEGHTGETAKSVGVWLRNALTSFSDPNKRGRNLGIAAALGGVGGYGANKLTGGEHPLLSALAGAGLGAYLNSKSMQATAEGRPWLNTKYSRAFALANITTKKVGSALLSENIHGALNRLVSQAAELSERDRADLISIIQQKPEWELLALLRQVGGGLVGGGVVSFLASKLLGKRARLPGAILGYLMGNILRPEEDKFRNLNVYGRSY